jgi:hypothetical protein
MPATAGSVLPSHVVNTSVSGVDSNVTIDARGRRPAEVRVGAARVTVADAQVRVVARASQLLQVKVLAGSVEVAVARRVWVERGCGPRVAHDDELERRASSGRLAGWRTPRRYLPCSPRC